MILVRSIQSVTFRIGKTSFENLIVRRPLLEMFFKVITAGSESSVLLTVEISVDAVGVRVGINFRTSFAAVTLVAPVVFCGACESKFKAPITCDIWTDG